MIAALVFWEATSTPAGVAELIHPGTEGPAVDIVRADFPDAQLAPGTGHDGQQFYAIARSPMHLSEVADSLARARYRLQRPLLSWLSWSLHPSGGGPGLVIGMFLVGTASVLGLALVSTKLSSSFGGGTWPAIAVPLLPGVWASLRIGVADVLALALVLLSVHLAVQRRVKGAFVAAALAVLAKEAVFVVLVGQALARRRLPEFVAAAGAAVTAGTWWLFLRLAVPADGIQVVEFTWPLGGLWDSAMHWARGEELIGAANYLLVVVVVLIAVAVARRDHPLFGGFVASAAFSTVLGKDVVGPDYNGTRTLMPLLLLGLLIIASRRFDTVTVGGAGREPAECGRA